MAYDETYSFDSLAANSSDFSFIGPDYSVLSAENTDGAWCWTSTGSTSSSTGPPSGTACVYTETSSPVTVGEVFTMTLAAANEVDASAYLLYVTFDTCTYGNTDGTLVFEAFDGTDWNTIATFYGGSTTTMTSRGPYNLTSYDNDDFSVRFVVTVGNASATYHNDFAVDEVRIYGEDAVTDPVITDAGDEDYTLYETNITVTGTDFGTNTGSADLELGDSATYASATKVSQSIDTWADTSIQFDLTIGTLDQEQLWLYVTNSDGDVSNAWEVNVNMTPTLTDCGDELFDTDEENITLTGTVFESTKGAGKLELSDNATYATGTKVTQSTDTWANTSIQFDLTIGALTAINLWLWVTNDLGFRNSTGYPVQVYRTPTITNIEDEEFNASETGIVLDGTNFASSQGTGKVEISDNATYATGSKEEQTIDSWGASQITFDLELGSIGTETMWMWVTNDVGERNATGTEVTITGLPISDGLWKTANMQGVITSAGYTATAFLIRDE